MIGDRFYMFACSVCNKDEFIKRMEMTWCVSKVLTFIAVIDGMIIN